MGIQTIHTCDRCGVETDSDKKMWWVGVAIWNSYATYSYHKIRQENRRYLCQKCLISLKLLSETGKEFWPDKPKPGYNIEDLITEIAQNAIEDYR